MQIDVECVGRTFLIHYIKSMVYNSTHEQLQHDKQQKKTKTKQKKKKIKKKIEVNVDWECPLDDYYALLGIKQYEFNISPDNLKRACMYHLLYLNK